MACDTSHQGKIAHQINSYIQGEENPTLDGFKQLYEGEELLDDKVLKAYFNYFQNQTSLLDPAHAKSTIDAFTFMFINSIEGTKHLNQFLKESGFIIDPDLNVEEKLTLAKGRAASLIGDTFEFMTGDRNLNPDLYKSSGWVNRVQRETGLTLDEVSWFVMASHGLERNQRGRDIFLEDWARKFSVIDSQQQAIQDEIADLDNRLKKRAIEKNKYSKQKSSLKRKYDRLQEKMDQHIKDQDNIPEKKSGLTDDQARDILANPKYKGKEDILRKYYKEYKKNVLDKSLDIMREGGVISEEQYTELTQGSREGSNTFEWYVPLTIDTEKLDANMKASFKGGLYGLSKKEGIDIDKRYNPFYSGLEQFVARAEYAKQNEAKMALANLLKVYPTEYGKILGGGYSPVIDDYGNIRYFEGYLSPEQMENSIPYYENGVHKRVFIQPLENGDKHPVLEAFEALKYDPNVLAKGMNSILSVMRMAITNRNPFFPPFNFFRDFFEVTLANSVAIKKDTGIKNFRRKYANNVRLALVATLGDVPGFKWAKLGLSTKNFNRFSKSLTEVLHHPDAGGFTTYSNWDFGLKKLGHQLTKADISKVDKNTDIGKPFRQMGRWLDSFSDAFENANRLAVYMTLRENGQGIQKSAYWAKEATLNFETGGRLRPRISPFYIFFNVGMKSAKKGGEILFDRKITVGKDGKARAKHTLNKARTAAWFSAVMGSSFILRSMFHALQDDEDKNVIHDKWKQGNYFLVPIPGGDGFLTLPKPYTIARAPLTMGEYLADVVFGYRNFSLFDAAGGVLRDIAKAADPINATEAGWASVAPTLLQPAVQAAMNKHWAGGKIVPTFWEDDVSMMPTEKYWKSTSEYAKAISRGLYATGISSNNKGIWATPIAIDYVLDHYLNLGVLGELNRLAASQTKDPKTGLTPNSKNLAELIEEFSAGELEWDVKFGPTKNIPLVRRVYTNPESEDFKRSILIHQIYEDTRVGKLTDKEKEYVEQSLWILREKGVMNKSTQKRFMNNFERKFDIGITPRKPPTKKK